ncbi:MAG: hypothetical protein HY904_06615 [Deltaproteobacteria bacterium]|nr:hypothetical protein [Deltaproteobacteria bacterium]
MSLLAALLLTKALAAQDLDGDVAPPAPPPAAAPAAPAAAAPAPAPAAVTQPTAPVTGAWSAGLVTAASATGALLGLSLLLGLTPLVVVAPFIAPAAGAVAGLAAVAVAGAQRRRVPVLGVVLATALAQAAGCIVGVPFGCTAAALGLLSFQDDSVRWPLLAGTLPMLGAAAALQVVAALLGGFWVLTLAGPCARPREPWEDTWNVDLTGTPTVREAQPRWLRHIEELKKLPDWEEPQPRKKRAPRRRVERKDPEY